jgi:spermidine synthase
METMARRETDLWFTEYQTPDMRLGLRISDILLNVQTPYQHLLVVKTEQYGNLMALDGAIMITDRDEFTYHEMMSHLALCSHPSPRRVLVVGGGDGGIVRELVRYDVLEKVTLVDIDEQVIEASRKFFPSVSSALDHPKVEVRPMDALVYIKDHQDEFDVIIVDSTDPVDFAAGLFEEAFFRDVHRALRDDGMVVSQTESPMGHPDILRTAYLEMKKVFPVVELCWGIMPTYPTGSWTYTLASKIHDPRKPFRLPPEGTKYYSPKIHEACFVLPPFLEKILGEGQDPV